MSTYSYSKQLNVSFSQAVERIKAALSANDFGILTEIDVRATLKHKLNLDFDNYLILGVCNPSLAYQALQAEREIGLFLPCNVIIYEAQGKIFVAVILPTVAIGMISNPLLADIARQAENKLKQVIDSLNS